MSDTRVDVITAVHGEYAGFLAAAWTSLQRQDDVEWTWLIQVDGPDAEVLRALETCGAAADDRVDVCSHGTLEGPAVTRNLALARVTAEFAQNLDADDELEPGALHLLAAALRRDPASAYAIGHARDLLPGGTLREHALPIEPGRIPRGALVRAWTRDPSRLPVHPAGILWRSDVLVRMGGWSALAGMEDTGLLMATNAVAEGRHVDRPVLRYRIHAGQRSARESKFNGGGGSNGADPPTCPASGHVVPATAWS